ncbi:VirB6/TrbL-like conjugal transfer protein, CD1112 family [Peptoniphilaceae bacterium SGI.131]
MMLNVTNIISITSNLMIINTIKNAFFDALKAFFVFVIDGIGGLVKSAILPQAVNSLSEVNGVLQNQTTEVVTNVSKSPANFVKGAYDMVEIIKTEVIVPIALVIFGYIMVYELFSIISDKNNFKNFDTYDYARYVLMFVFGLIVIDNTTPIIETIMDIGIFLIKGANSIISTNISTSFFANPEGVRTELEALSNWTLISTIFGMNILSLLLRVLNYLTLIIVIGRMFEIYIYIVLSPIPIAFLFSNKLESTGIGFIKQLFALSIQGFMILLVISIYSSIINNLSISGGIMSVLSQITIYSIVLVLSLFKTKTIATKILGA